MFNINKIKNRELNITQLEEICTNLYEEKQKLISHNSMLLEMIDFFLKEIENGLLIEKEVSHYFPFKLDEINCKIEIIKDYVRRI